MFRSQNAIGLAILFFAVSAVWPASAADEKKEAGDKSAAAQSTEKKTAEHADPYTVPEGTPKELIEFIKKLKPQLLHDQETATKAQQVILKAADKILAAKGNAEEMKFAVEVKMNMLQNEKQLASFAEELHNGGHEALAQQVHGFTLQLELHKAMTAGLEKKKEAIADALKFFEAAPPQLPDVASAVMAGRLAERTSDNNLAIDTYRSLAKVFGASKDRTWSIRQDARWSRAAIESGGQRDEDRGQAARQEGVRLVEIHRQGCAGRLLGYLGRPVRGRNPQHEEVYNLYHAQGFDIVGLSCDRNLADLEKFVKEKSIPWAIVFGDGKPSPTVSYYGIMSVPTMVLVGKDGRVVSLNARGEKLKEELAKLLGPVEEMKEVKGGEEKKQSRIGWPKATRRSEQPAWGRLLTCPG